MKTLLLLAFLIPMGAYAQDVNPYMKSLMSYGFDEPDFKISDDGKVSVEDVGKFPKIDNKRRGKKSVFQNKNYRYMEVNRDKDGNIKDIVDVVNNDLDPSKAKDKEAGSGMALAAHTKFKDGKITEYSTCDLMKKYGSASLKNFKLRVKRPEKKTLCYTVDKKLCDDYNAVQPGVDYMDAQTKIAHCAQTAQALQDILGDYNQCKENQYDYMKDIMERSLKVKNVDYFGIEIENLEDGLKKLAECKELSDKYRKVLDDHRKSKRRLGKVQRAFKKLKGFGKAQSTSVFETDPNDIAVALDDLLYIGEDCFNRAEDFYVEPTTAVDAADNGVATDQ